MSITYRGLGARRRALAILTAGALAAGVSATTATANPAEPAPDSTASTETLLGAGRYVVLLAQPGATRYDGGVKGFAPTEASAGNNFDARSDKVKQYARYLERQQGQVAASVDAGILSQTTIAASSFTAELSAEQATELAADRDVMTLVKDTAFAMDTWNTPRFLGLESASGTGTGGVWEANRGVDNAGKGVVVGILDSGIWPESGSFAGKQLKSKPNGKYKPYRSGTTIVMDKADGTQFRGFCEPGVQWDDSDCNEKLIGARYYPEAFVASVPPSKRYEHEFLSTRDGDGHGSHTAGTAAGIFGVPASVEGRDFGTVSGMAPAAKIAAYKVCFSDTDPATGGCYTSSTLAAVDDAIKDGVDVINYSISGATNTVVDAVEYAFLGAAAAGIFVAASAGNSGPTASTVAHNSPWVTTVAASTHAVFENTVVLGNGTKLKGASINGTALPSTPLVLSTSAGLAGKAAEDVRLCAPGSLDPAKVTGKVVVCDRGVVDRVLKSAAVKQAGGVGMVLTNTTPGSLDSDFHGVPSVHLDEVAGAVVKAYVATSAPTVSFEIGDTTGGTPTVVPQIAGFSSRGPAIASGSDVLKPDITGPGVSVLAAVAPPSGEGRNFDLYSGTSMSSPHIAGLAAFILGRNPGWSPMTVKSAMMTTAYDLKKADGSPDTDPFAQGAGHVDPTKFFDPGLVVVSDKDDWMSFMKGQGATGTAFQNVQPIAANSLNTPSIAQGQVAATPTITRTFTGLRTGTWKVAANVPGYAVTTDKPSVAITSVGQEVPVAFTFTRTDAPLSQYAKGFITLTGPTTVRMPVALRPVPLRSPATVAGTGADGRVAIAVTPGYSGTLDIAPSGLAKATTVQQSLAVGESLTRDVTIAAGTKVARFVADAANNAADLDLTVYRLNAAGQPVAIAGQSATGAADETVTLTNPVAANYRVVVDGYDAAPGETTIGTTYDQYLLDGTATLGGFKAEPDPLTVEQGKATSYDAVWSGLTTGRYLGLMEYNTSPTPTYVTVTVP
ncbi:S8 family serine peptidase [Nocardioides zhouii]|uniref:Protease n=1 Tax=Nocardioides zhouii TaxID=1168729 RepID=A0A4Q2SXT5_9ACTN|nr:S8 family serine peptidase [Nocardioides zhouii]RYC11026.1 protease [Nocardioides zhouii]